MAGVSLKSVSKSFEKESVAVDDVSIDVADKEFMVLVGPSGCGKSTTLRIIAGLDDASGGEIYIGDRLVNDVAPKDRDIAMVFQNYALYPHMTVFDNMSFALKLRKVRKPDIERRVNEAAEILGLSHLLKRKPKALSGGERQRVALGRAIVRDPKVFLFDEPLSNLDAKLRVSMRAEIKKLHNRLAATMIYVTHDQTEAMTMGDRIAVMKDGKVLQVDTPLNIYNQPVNRFVAGFIGSPAMNFMDCRVVQNGGLSLQSGDERLAVPGKIADKLSRFIDRNIVLGIRPENIFTPARAKGLDQKAKISARVDVVETMGSETLVYLTSGPNSLIARLEANDLPKVNENLELFIDLSAVHFFDQETDGVV